MKIGQYLAKLWARVGCPVLLTGYSATFTCTADDSTWHIWYCQQQIEAAFSVFADRRLLSWWADPAEWIEFNVIWCIGCDAELWRRDFIVWSLRWRNQQLPRHWRWHICHVAVGVQASWIVNRQLMLVSLFEAVVIVLSMFNRIIIISSGLHHYQCIVPLVANSLQSGRFWAKSTVSVHDSLWKSRSFCTIFIQSSAVVLVVSSNTQKARKSRSA